MSQEAVPAIVVRMARTTVNVDDKLLRDAKKALGTRGLTETINAAMEDVVRRAARADFTVLDFDITGDDLAAARSDRMTAGG
jgi:Arc/MetJ family transcription regulator